MVYDVAYDVGIFNRAMGKQLPFSWGAVHLHRRNTALLPVKSVVAPHRQANAKAGESTTFMFFMILMKETICLQIT